MANESLSQKHLLKDCGLFSSAKIQFQFRDMSNRASSSPDKNIVDRSRASRNQAVARTVKATRERLQMNGSAIRGFDKDMLLLHLSSVQQSAALLPLFVLLTGLFANYY